MSIQFEEKLGLPPTARRGILRPVSDISKMRRSYHTGKLSREGLAPDPVSQFEKWFADALACPEVHEANAMTLATAGSDLRVSARTILLKGVSPAGFTFFTNYGSQKARELAENPQAALLFTWLPLERQVSIRGQVEKTTLTENLAYFSSRPLESQLGAWASEQSAVIESRDELEAKYAKIQEKFSGGLVPLPNFWGGYRVIPATVEFWQGRVGRLHDRFLYKREEDGWRIERLSP
ncbi:pyridoxamine 5'-phosphate oxidase [soil metagenome]